MKTPRCSVRPGEPCQRPGRLCAAVRDALAITSVGLTVALFAGCGGGRPGSLLDASADASLPERPADGLLPDAQPNDVVRDRGADQAGDASTGEATARPDGSAIADATTDVGCGTGLTLCPAGCADLDHDAQNCGRCGNACPLNQVCDGTGHCAVCAVGATRCGGATPVCADLQTDPNHCGACETGCAGGASCVAGRCACPPGQAVCEGTCADLANDSRNCGACDVHCISPYLCQQGVCLCNHPGETSCTGAATFSAECVDVTSDPLNCGGCARVCSMTSTCNGLGHCAKSCAAGFTICGTKHCADLNNDPESCGACFRQCPSGASCQLGQCQCPAGQTACPGVNACTDLTSDPGNCGACGNTCQGGTGCVGSVCTCPAGTTPCGGLCVDTQSDPENCGGCGLLCPSGLCAGGACAACPSADVSCSGQCVDTSSDPANCGACGASCPNGTCQGGACTCPASTTYCSNIGCGANRDSEADCGAAGATCALGQVCAGASCLKPAAPALLANETVAGAGFVSDGLNLYFLNSTSDVQAVPVTGGPVQTLTTGSGDGVAIDATSVYWTLGTPPSTLWRRALSGGAPVLVLTAPANCVLHDIAADTTGLFLAEGCGFSSLVVELPPGATSTTTIWGNAAPVVDVSPLAASGGNLYWLGAGLGGELVTASESGSGWPAVVDAASSVNDFAVSDSGLFYTVMGQDTVLEAPPGGGPSVPIATGQPAPGAIAVDAAAVYWFDQGDGTIRKQSLCGGQPVILAQGQDARELAVDAQNLYWGGQFGIWKAPK
jgi:hypothetical protein